MSAANSEELSEIIIGLVSTGAEAERLSSRLQEINAKRAGWIRRAYALGLSARAIADAARIAHSRVIQIAGATEEPRKQARPVTQRFGEFLASNAIFHVQLSEGTPINPDGSVGPPGLGLEWAGLADSESNAIERAQKTWLEVHKTPFPGGLISVELSNPSL
ncbi:MAG: hypothetical protein M3065_20585 [Actinomycetota bacterium]|nr:hypothetical protein [Actinomycetota bacterium]